MIESFLSEFLWKSWWLRAKYTVLPLPGGRPLWCGALPNMLTGSNLSTGLKTYDDMLPLNVWANPAYWPFAISDGKWAADTSGLIALTCFAAACYAMARCFDLSVVASAVAAQLSILIFGPVLVLVGFTSVFVLTPGFAVVYAPHMLALGLLARIEAGKLANFVLFTSGLFLLLLYSLYCDPLWS